MLSAIDLTDSNSTHTQTPTQPTREFAESTKKCHIPLIFSETFSQEALELFAFPTDMLKMLEVGTKFYIKGSADEDVVLCTLSETYMMRSADTSNSLLVSERMNVADSRRSGSTKTNTDDAKDNAHEEQHTTKESNQVNIQSKDVIDKPDSDMTGNKGTNKRTRESVPSEAAFWASQSQRPQAKEMIKVHAVAKTCYELKKTRPRIERLPQLLNECPYSGEGDDAERSGQTKYTRDELLEHVQASEVEVDSAIERLLVIEHEGYLRLLDKLYGHKITALLLQAITLLDMDYTAVDLRLCRDALREAGHSILDCVLRTCIRSLTDIDDDDDNDLLMRDAEHPGIYKLSAEKIILFRADEILTAVGENMDYDEFMEAWDATLTSPMKANEQLLRGLALVKTDSFNKTIIKLDAKAFSYDPATRFQQLFSVQKEWTLDSIMPYVTPLCSPGERPATILAKYSRSSIHPITKLKTYNSRYGVK